MQGQTQAQIISDTNAIFSQRFPGFNAEPYEIRDSKLYLPFTWIKGVKRSGIMVYDIKGSASATLDPFTSSPQPFSENGIEWVNMKYVTHEPSIQIYEKYLNKLLGLRV